MHAAAHPSPYQQHAMAYDQPAPTHPILVGYLMWGLGFTGLHRFYFGKPLTGILWFFTGGLFLIGWIVDLFLIPAMANEANRRYRHGRIDHTVAWLLHLFLGFLVRTVSTWARSSLAFCICVLAVCWGLDWSTIR